MSGTPAASPPPTADSEPSSEHHDESGSVQSSRPSSSSRPNTGSSENSSGELLAGVTLPPVIIKYESLSWSEVLGIFWKLLTGEHEEEHISEDTLRAFLSKVSKALMITKQDEHLFSLYLNHVVIFSAEDSLLCSKRQFEYIMKHIATCVTGHWFHAAWSDFFKKLFMAITRRRTELASGTTKEYPPIAHPLSHTLYTRFHLKYPLLQSSTQNKSTMKDFVKELSMLVSLAETHNSPHKLAHLTDSLQSASASIRSSQVDQLFNHYIRNSTLVKEHRQLEPYNLLPNEKKKKKKKLTKKQQAELEKKRHRVHMKMCELAEHRRQKETEQKLLVSFSFRKESHIHPFMTMIQPVNMLHILQHVVTPLHIASSTPLDSTSLNSQVECLHAAHHLAKRIHRCFLVNLNPIRDWDIYHQSIIQVLWKDSSAEEMAFFNKRPNNFLVYGPPASGKNRLAQAISQHFNSVYINIDDHLLQRFADESQIGQALYNVFPDVHLPEKPEPPKKEPPKKKKKSKKKKSAKQIAAEEEEKRLAEEEELRKIAEEEARRAEEAANPPPPPSIDEEHRFAILKQLLLSPQVAHRGYVLVWNSYTTNTRLLELISNNLPKYMVQLECDDQETQFRLKSLEQSEQHSIDQLEEEISAVSSQLDTAVDALKEEYSKLEESYKNQSSATGAGEEEEEEEDAPEEEPEEEEYELDEDGEPLVDEEGNPIPKKKKPTIAELNKQKKELLFRQLVVKERLETRSNSQTTTEDLNQVIERVSRSRENGLVQLDATLQDATKMLEFLIQKLNTEVPTPLAMSPPANEDLGEEAEDEDLFQFLLTEKKLRLSPVWKKFCPVAYKDGVKPTSQLQSGDASNSEEEEETADDEIVTPKEMPPGHVVAGSPKHAVLYRGILYCMHSAAAAEAFRSNPHRYLTVKPFESKTVLIVGNPTIASHKSCIELLKRDFPLYNMCSLDYFVEHGEKTPLQGDDSEAVEEEEEEEPVKKKKKTKNKSPPLEFPPIEPNEPKVSLLDAGCFIDATFYHPDMMQKVIEERILPQHVVILEVPEPSEEETEESEEELEFEVDENGDPLLDEDGEKIVKKSAETPSDGIPDLFKKYNMYKEHIDTLISKFEEFSVPLTNVPSTKDASAQMHQIRSDVDAFHCVATQAEAEESDESDASSQVINLGVTKNFCPVSLKDKNLLVLGSTEFTAVYKNRRYTFNGESELNTFLADPQKYTENLSLPPASYWIVGIPSSGRSSAAQFISDTFNIPVMRFEESYMESYASKPGYSKIKQLFEEMRYVPPKPEKETNGEDDDEEEAEEEEVDEEVVAARKRAQLHNIFCSLLQHEPFKSKGYVLDGCPNSSEEAQLLLKGGLGEEEDEDAEKTSANSELKDARPWIPDLVISYSLSAKLYVTRTLPSRLQEVESKKIARATAKAEKEEAKRQRMLLKRNSEEEEEEEEEEDEEEEELPDRAAIEEALNESHAELTEQVASLVEFLKEARVPVLEISAQKTKRTNHSLINKRVFEQTQSRESLLLNGHHLTHADALERLRLGHVCLNRSFGYQNCVRIIDIKTRNQFFTPTVNPFLRTNRILVRVQLLNGDMISSLFTYSSHISDIQSYIDKYVASSNVESQQYNIRIGAEVYEQDGSGFWFEHLPEETFKQHQKRIKKLKRKQKVLPSLFELGYTDRASVTIPLEVELENWIELKEEPKPPKKPSEDDDEEEEEPEEEEEEDDDEEEETSSDEYELDEDGEPLLDEDGNPIPKKKPQPPPLSYPVQLENQLYFFDTANEREEFLRNPSHFEAVHSGEMFEAIPDCSYAPRGAVLSNSPNRELLARSVASHLSAYYLNLNMMVQELRQIASASYLANQISTMLSDGSINSEDELPDELVTRLIKHRINSWECQTCGFILDDLPSNVELAKQFTASGLKFDRVLFIAPTDNDLFLVQDYFETQFHNVFSAANEKKSQQQSEWGVCSSFEDSILQRVTRRHRHFELTRRGKPSSIYDIGVTPSEFEAKLGKFKQYCPVSFVQEEALVKVDDAQHEFCVEFNNEYYSMQNQAKCDQFMKEPHRFIMDKYSLPKDLPEQDVSFADADEPTVEVGEDEEEIKRLFTLQGFDPVMLKTKQENGEPIAVRGKSRYAIRYKEQTYRVASAANLLRFMRQPWLYADAELPSKIPAQKRDYPNLGILRYLEESMQQRISKALIELNRERPKHPCMSTQESALKFVALFLWRSNPENHEELQKKFDKEYAKFLRACALCRKLHEGGVLDDETDKRFLSHVLKGHNKLMDE